MKAEDKRIFSNIININLKRVFGKTGSLLWVNRQLFFFVKLQFIIVLTVAGSVPVSAFSFVYNVKLMKYIFYNMAFVFSSIFLSIILQF